VLHPGPHRPHAIHQRPCRCVCKDCAMCCQPRPGRFPAPRCSARALSRSFSLSVCLSFCSVSPTHSISLFLSFCVSLSLSRALSTLFLRVACRYGRRACALPCKITLSQNCLVGFVAAACHRQQDCQQQAVPNALNHCRPKSVHLFAHPSILFSGG